MVSNRKKDSQSEPAVPVPDWLTNPNQKATFRKLSEEERERLEDLPPDERRGAVRKAGIAAGVVKKAGPGRGKKTSDNITRLRGTSAEYRLCKEDRELHGLLVKHRPSPSGPKGGRPKKENCEDASRFPDRPATGTRAYIEQRLQAKFREAMKEQGNNQHTSKPNIVRDAQVVCGNSKAYTCERLRRYRRGQ